MACPFCTMPGGRHDDGCPYDNGDMEARIAYLEGELRRIAHGNWSSPHIDSASADTYARIADEMQNIAKLALTAIVNPVNK